MADVLPLVGDGDDLDLIREVERAFGIRFADRDLESCQTIGDLHALILAAVPHAERTDATCLAAMAFFRLRWAIEAEHPGRIIQPATPLADLTGRFGADYWLGRLRRRTGQRMPTPALGATGCALNLAAIAGSAACVVTWGWLGLVPALPLLSASVAVSGRWLSALPKPTATVGDLARVVAALNVSALADRDQPVRTREIWPALQAIIQDNLALTAPVQPTTRFFKEKG
ncbi:hypothetical protein QFZ27_003417 [Inquilinus ginsengisoli]|uniref:acyl carrier protein n=1 Tax=Inquilinus ginsengisoli TaxID=363840 RepID=UPI003D1CCDE3